MAQQPEHGASGDPFVVKETSGDVDAVRDRLSDVAEVEPIAEDLLVVTPRRNDGEVRSLWRRISDALESAEWVVPVVVDDAGRQSYPTGALTVRFAGERSDSQLAEFAEKYALRFLRRNEYVPEQAVFEPSKPRETFLPELVERVQEDDGVGRAWPVTVSRYERADSI